MKTIIHVNQSVIRANVRDGKNDPAIIVRQGKKRTYCHDVEILGPSRLVTRMDKPLDCGARIWIETEASVNYITHESSNVPVCEAA